MVRDPVDIIRKVPIARDAVAEVERIQRQVEKHDSLPAALLHQAGRAQHGAGQ